MTKALELADALQRRAPVLDGIATIDLAVYELRRLDAANKELVEVLREVSYALDYASDMTKPEGLSGCNCPICTAGYAVDAAIAKHGEMK